MPGQRIELINCTPEIIHAILAGDERLAEQLQVTVPSEWSEFGAAIFQYTLEQITENPEALIWWAYLPIDKASQTLLGTCGYKGAPNEQGEVEIGYEVARDFRNRGFATEMTQLLLKQAFDDPQVNRVLAHTLAEENASVRVLQKCGFSWVEELTDPEEGAIWKWKKNR